MLEKKINDDLKLQRRRRSDRDAPAVPDDPAADRPDDPDDADDTDDAGHWHPRLRIVPTRLRLGVPSRLRIDVSPGLQRRRRRRDDDGAGYGGAPVRPGRDDIAARLQLRGRAHI